MNKKDNRLAEKAKECFYREEIPEGDNWKEHNIYCARRNTYYTKSGCNAKDCFLYSIEEVKINHE